jgi:hypothetical protein
MVTLKKMKIKMALTVTVVKMPPQLFSPCVCVMFEERNSLT